MAKQKRKARNGAVEQQISKDLREIIHRMETTPVEQQISNEDLREIIDRMETAPGEWVDSSTIAKKLSEGSAP